MTHAPQHRKQITLPQGFLSPVVVDLYQTLNTHDAKTLFVGGCVRDAVLGEAAADIDLATTLTPEAATKTLKSAGFKVEPTGIDHGTVMAIKDGEAYEITTLRRDVSTDGRHAEVEYTTDFYADAARRDFTFNAMYMDDEGNITDWFGGLDDLEKGKVRFVGDPSQRLAEDWLRALRYVRFYGRFGQTAPTADTFSALKAAAAELKNLSAERITTEVLKTLLTPKAPESLKLMQELEYLPALGLKNFSVENSQAFIKTFPETTDPLALLLAGVWSAQGAPEETLLENRSFRFSNRQRRFIRAMSPRNLKSLDEANIPYSCWALGADNAAQLWRYKALFAPENPNMEKKAAEKAAGTNVPDFPLSGNDLLDLGYQPGPEMGAVLKKTEAWWAKNGFPDKQACLKRLQ